MNQKTLKFKLIYLARSIPETTDDSPCNAEQFLQCFIYFFEKSAAPLINKNYTVQFETAHKKHTSSLYNELLYEMECTVNIPDIHFNINSLYAKICRLWCTQGESINELQWLRPARQGFSNDKMQVHSDLGVNEFALGTLVGLKQFVCHYRFLSSGKGNRDTSCTFVHSAKKIIIIIYEKHQEFCPSGNKSFYKIEIPYSSLLRILVKDVKGTHPTRFYMLLDHPPLLYIDITDNNSNENNNSLKISAGRSPEVYERTNKFGCKCTKSECCKDIIGSCSVVCISVLDKFRAHHVLGRLYQRCSSTEIYYCPVSSIIARREAYNNLKMFSFFSASEKSKFKIHYAWRVLLNRSCEIGDHIRLEDADWKKMLALYNKKNPVALEKTFYYIFRLLEKGKIIVFKEALKFIFKEFDKISVDADLSPGIVLVSRLFVTPTRNLFLPPQMHFNNRVLREFGPDYALRVSFRDDNLKKLTYSVLYHSKRDEFIEDIIGKVLRTGIHLVDRCYKFLASSNSQLRDHGVWMYAKDANGKTAESIRTWMGDFSGIHSIAKLIARMGQCFSTSEEAVQICVLKKYVKELNDIKIEQKEYVFSDGIGMLSEELADEVREAFFKKYAEDKVSGSTYVPSAFQIRYAGCKGMLVQMPLPEGCKMAIRPSMKKFECSTSNYLEVVKISAPRQLYLNRPLICILEQMGVPIQTFIHLHQNMVINRTEALISEPQAIDLLKSSISDFPFANLSDAGISLTSEPFFRSLLVAIYGKIIGDLSLTARIAVPFEYGRNMLGVLDEFKILNYGQVFIQYSENIGLAASKLHILEGPVLVTRSPCMHPGDVRILTAVNVPKLHHVKDCVVFPAKGKRPHPDEMAGGDLDGDEYIVIWMPQLMFKRENFEPMKYPHSNPGQKNSECQFSSNFTVDDMVDFLCQYVKKDFIGILASSHLANADVESEGIFSKKCMSIAKKFPLSVDFAKTGKTAFLNPSDKPEKYPDFMEKGGLKNSYHSHKALGVLYRHSRSLKAVSTVSLAIGDVNYDQNLEYPGWEEYAQSARIARDIFNQKMDAILLIFEVEYEAEAISANIWKLSKYSQEKNDRTNVAALVKTQIKSLCNEAYTKFIHDVNEESVGKELSVENREKALFCRASAWYMVTYTEKPIKYLSFPWCLADILVKVRMACLSMKQSKPCLVSCLEDKINSYVLNYNMKELLIQDNCFQDSSSLEVPRDTKKELHCSNQHTAVKILEMWAWKNQLFLLMNDKSKLCPDCPNMVFQYFLDHSKGSTEKQSCSEDHCVTGDSREYSASSDTNCHSSVGQLILDFLKFYAVQQSSPVPLTCSEHGCVSFDTLQIVALRTFVMVAITYDISHLGIGDPNQYLDNLEEGEPVRVSAESQLLQDLMTEHLPEVEGILKKLSGIRDLCIEGDQDSKGCWSMIVNCSGKDWQIWKLHDLILRDSLPEILQSYIERNDQLSS